MLHADYLFIIERTLNLVFKDTKLTADTSSKYMYMLYLNDYIESV